MRRLVAALAVMVAGPALADPPAMVRMPDVTPHAAGQYRLKPVKPIEDPTFRINDPRSKFSTGYGGSMVDLFPFAGGKFHLSAGPRLFGRAGRPRPDVTPEPLLLLPAFRAPGMKMSRRMTPAMLIGYGRPVEQGLAFGIDMGMMKGKMSAVPDRVGRLNRSRIESDLSQASAMSRGRAPSQMNQLVRLTALYRF